MMKIAISGASGFVGTHLTTFFEAQNINVVPLDKELFQIENENLLATTLMGCDVVINLAGASISKRWTESYKREIYNSRIEVTRALVNCINSLPVKPKLFLSTSAVGYYSSDGSYSELNAKMGNGFLSGVCRDWEQQARRVSSEVRCVITRFGVVLSKDGGAFPKMIRGVGLKLMVRIGKGDNFMTWISVNDLLRAYDFVIRNEELSGVVNFCSPNPVTGRDFSLAVASHYGVKFVIPFPKCLFHTILGEQASLMTDSQRVYPERLLQAGFEFHDDTLENFLKNS